MISQPSIAVWREYLGSCRIADATIDRLAHNAHRIELTARESMRNVTLKTGPLFVAL